MVKVLTIFKASDMTSIFRLPEEELDCEVLSEDSNYYVIALTGNFFIKISKELRHTEDFKYWLYKEDYEKYKEQKDAIPNRRSEIHTKVLLINDIETLDSIIGFIDNLNNSKE